MEARDRWPERVFFGTFGRAQAPQGPEFCERLRFRSVLFQGGEPVLRVPGRSSRAAFLAQFRAESTDVREHMSLERPSSPEKLADLGQGTSTPESTPSRGTPVVYPP